MYIKYTNVQVYLMYKYGIWNVPTFHIEFSYIKMHTYTLHNKCTHIHMHTTIHKGEKSDLLRLKNEKKTLHVETLEKTYTVHNIADHGGVTNGPSSCGQCASSLPNACLFSMCSYSTAQCTDRQSFWGRLLRLKNKPFLCIYFFVLLNCLYVFLSFF